MTESTIVQTYVDLALSTPSATDEQLSSALQDAGISIDHAERAVAFVPMAFARVVLRGAAFPDEFLIRDPDTGVDSRGRFTQEPIFLAALALAEKLAASDDRTLRVAGRSAEMNVAKELLKPGGHPSDIGFVEPILMRISTAAQPDHEGRRSDPEAVPSQRKGKPWWRFW